MPVVDQANLMPKDDLTPYAGLWVALRDGRIVASAVDPLALRDMDEVQEDDTLLPVPDSQTGLFVL